MMKQERYWNDQEEKNAERERDVLLLLVVLLSIDGSLVCRLWWS